MYTLKINGYIAPDSFIRIITCLYAEGGVIAYDYRKTTDWDKVGQLAIGVDMMALVAFLIVATDGAAAPVLAPVLIP